MATRGYEHVTLADLKQHRNAPKPSKYRNVKTVIDGERFDSAKEANCYAALLARLKRGEVRELRRQVPFDLLAPMKDRVGYAVVSQYVADFVYEEHDHGWGGVTWSLVVEDAKGHRTAIYQLKKKWLFLQTGIVIRET